jgi:glycerol uptake facilitator protein
VLALTDAQNTAPTANLGPLLIGLVVVGIGMAYGTDAGYAINPARDLGPRLASFLTGYHGAWRDQYGNFYYWVPILGPLVGGLVGAGAYRLLVQPFLPKPLPELEPGQVRSAESGQPIISG